MSQADTIVLLTYLIGVLVVGVIFASSNKTTADMFAAGGRSPWWVAGLSGFMTMFSAGTFVVWGGIAYKHGLVAVTINFCYGIAALLVGWSVAGRWKQSGIKTPAEYVKLRFGKHALHFYTAAIMIFRLISTAVALYSLCVLMVAMMPMEEGGLLRDQSTGNFSLQAAILLMGGVVVLYTMLGGLWGVLMTDVLQFIVLNVVIFFVVPLAFFDVGGIRSFLDATPERFLAPTGGDYTWLFLAGWIGVHYFAVGAEWAFVQRFLCVPSPQDARKGACLFGVLYLVSPLLWLLPPMIQRVRVPIPEGSTATMVNSIAENAYIDVCRDILPTGMVGLMLAAMFSATASMISSQLNVFAGVLTKDIVMPWLDKNTKEHALIWLGRFFTVLLGCLIIGLALMIPRLGGAENVVVPATSLMVGPLLAPLLVGLISKKLPAATVWITAAICSLAVVLVKAGQYDLALISGLPGAIPIVQWVLSLGRFADILVGLVLPSLIVAVCFMFARGVSPGWTRLISISVSDNDFSSQSASDTPAKIVVWSLAVCGAMIISLTFWSVDGRLVLALFAIALWVVAATIFYSRKRMSSFSSQRSPDVEV